MRISRLIFSGATIGTIIGTGRVAAGMSGSSLVIVPGMGTTLANEAGPCKNAPAPPSPARPQAVRSWTPPGEAGSGGPPVEGRAERRGGGTLPLPRDAQQMVYDPATRSVLVFGGKGTRDRYFNDLWSYHAGGGWSRLSPRGVLPPARFGPGMAYDSARNKVVIFGGVLRTGSQLADDTWVYDRTPAHGCVPAPQDPARRHACTRRWPMTGQTARQPSSAAGPAPAPTGTPGHTTR